MIHLRVHMQTLIKTLPFLVFSMLLKSFEGVPNRLIIVSMLQEAGHLNSFKTSFNEPFKYEFFILDD